jgi:hypothetical protein
LGPGVDLASSADIRTSGMWYVGRTSVPGLDEGRAGTVVEVTDNRLDRLLEFCKSRIVEASEDLTAVARSKGEEVLESVCDERVCVSECTVP